LLPSLLLRSLGRFNTFLEVNQEHGVALAFPLNINLLTNITWLVLGYGINGQNRRTCWNPNSDSPAVLHDGGDSLPLQPKSLAYATQTTSSPFSPFRPAWDAKVRQS
jgi:hypothetical protein